MLDKSFWQGKSVFLTGHTGFKGSWLTLWLSQLGAKVSGYSLDPLTNPNLCELAEIAKCLRSDTRADVNDLANLQKAIAEARPEIVFHLAAQPLVRRSYRDPVGTFATNVMGTAHLLEALRASDSVRVVVIVTTDKVYRNVEWCWPYREDDQLGGHDPYSASKAACEIVVASYRDAFLREQGVAVASARAGNVIGGGDWSEDRLIPDVVRALDAKTMVIIRRPQAIRPWQHVLEPLAGYLLLAQKLWHSPELAGAYNLGPETKDAATVRQILEFASRIEPGLQVEYGDGNEGPHEAGWLSLEIAKARTLLGYRPSWGVEEAVRRTMIWYRSQRQGESPLTLCQTEIEEYEKELMALSDLAI
ncbi:CDP-glucose-4,6-dehydratase [Synechocystis sp. PCC 6803]|uniref:CDP-glucose-4,6-dehydratase n=1 Tax=Synechocystis sp. (strain ATCC 27184 / PCC 6803 / Kazusa) TaxID=1111708 RepID=P72886_SYNY3|nr:MULTISPECIES: CDP-glucose 4,6-dehydratase [unclassified Synechocystis]BAM50613.1 CDP-glucose-4,6-dehydratase [Synechocystis sp. PCC 6803] [Bacillus subtilis BEST7613]AGF50591.1 CDP-glucose-4,6-dehydratase [Synechocystis sp. PCC 6803]ALJ66668.1 CDP-glucose 4,6-dehydratase [Synechocystis sp. PCC 6803]AVP88511.1 CDP-glucose 4,6-dehydratase [Synechocystis sp. IPPAS B-1465]MBD2617190.1 CDP-glucose 4,6-dehydratase [Synechocystis sp. FACHB-898]